MADNITERNNSSNSKRSIDNAERYIPDNNKPKNNITKINSKKLENIKGIKSIIKKFRESQADIIEMAEKFKDDLVKKKSAPIRFNKLLTSLNKSNPVLNKYKKESMVEEVKYMINKGNNERKIQKFIISQFDDRKLKPLKIHLNIMPTSYKKETGNIVDDHIKVINNIEKDVTKKLYDYEFKE